MMWYGVKSSNPFFKKEKHVRVSYLVHEVIKKTHEDKYVFGGLRSV